MTSKQKGMFLADDLHTVEEGSPPAREGVERQLWHHLSTGPSVLAGVLHPSQLTLARPLSLQEPWCSCQGNRDSADPCSRVVGVKRALT